MAFDHMPGATVDLGMTAIGYNDWDEETAKRNRPVVFAYGGSEIKKNDPDISLTEFNLRGKFAKDTDDMKWIKRPGRGKEPEKLPGRLAGCHLPWTANERLAVVITGHDSCTSHARASQKCPCRSLRCRMRKS
ncbi:unnamed protein product [Effrenium voratum]|uniref:Uncharacterized protein n=1 Tax=Effrenium voratum TaxID=2562239 RepID=A0AA36JEV8_9DINO|nr:unnamed protein product [Effrenium voratum]